MNGPELTERYLARAAEDGLDDVVLPGRGLRRMEADVRDCTRCPLHKGRTKFVFGAGDPNARVMFIGEAPGAEEDKQGIPFVGRAGQLLDKIIEAIGFTRGEVYIGNMLKCRPPGNRDPELSEVNTCRPYLDEQISIISPSFIVCLGRIAAQHLLETKSPLKALRGRWHSYRDVPVLVTYHPAALLRDPSYKRPTWDDVRVLRAAYDERFPGEKPPLKAAR
jgi:uracil-DNA glycosylase family 4